MGQPKIERYILLTYEGDNHEFHNCETSDFRAVEVAIRALENKLCKMRGGLKKHFRGNPDNIIVRLK